MLKNLVYPLLISIIGDNSPILIQAFEEWYKLLLK